MVLIQSLLGTAFRLVFRLSLLAAGLVFAASLLVVLSTLAVAWGLRAVWARLTGRPVSPWLRRVRPMDGWRRFATQAHPASRRPGAGVVVDAEVVEVPARRIS